MPFSRENIPAVNAHNQGSAGLRKHFPLGWESHLALDFKRLSNLIPRYSRSLRKNLLPWRKNLGDGSAPFLLEYEQKCCFTYLWKQM
ncbi:MAG TPA: hypothetical protein VKR06_06970 [Ktedonosporobacter sp.]|nr:hypothetical protein [Ktedonosporobacter sp.]